MNASVVILTYKRPEILLSLLNQLKPIVTIKDIVVVDNDPNSKGIDKLKYDNVLYIINKDNYGTSARNIAIEVATGDVVICLDDDVFGLTEDMINIILYLFKKNTDVGAICFKILDVNTNKITNWCHHRDPEKWANKLFNTYEISEGAVAFRKETLNITGHYCKEFFISHEGLDLACRIIDNRYKIIYCPDIVVYHYHHEGGRVSWRRYYYDTRNIIYVAIRNYPVLYAIKYVTKQLGAMLYYCIRDGYIKYYFKAIYDGMANIYRISKQRNSMKTSSFEYIRDCDKYSPNILYYLKNRIFNDRVRI